MAAPVVRRVVMTRATVVSVDCPVCRRQPGLRADSGLAHQLQDKEKVLADVRAIISQQLGTELDKASRFYAMLLSCPWPC